MNFKLFRIAVKLISKPMHETFFNKFIATLNYEHITVKEYYIVMKIFTLE